MGLDEKRRQKKLAKKSVKRKAQRADKQIKSSTGEGHSPAHAAHFPIRDCLVPENLFEVGIGNVILTRSLPNGDLAIVVLLVDVYCLGVKNAFYRVASPEEYALNLDPLSEHGRLEQVHPSCLRKLVEGAVEYARDLGLAPHPDYARAAKLFGSIDPAACPVRYTYGKDGKPFYVSGPYESPAQSRKILNTLARRLGPEEFHFLTAVGASERGPATQAPGLIEVSYEITDEPLADTPYERLPEQVKDQLADLYHEGLLKKPEEAIALLPSLIEQNPDVPQLYNYLHVAYQRLGDRVNAERVLAETLRRFPDYLFGRIAYANECMDRGEPEKVPEIFGGKFELKLLYPDRERFHLSEVMGFYATMARYFHARGERARAETYYKLLRQLDPDHPNTRLIGQLLYPPRFGTWLRNILLRR